MPKYPASTRVPMHGNTTMRVRPDAGGMLLPHAPSNDTSGICRPFQGTTPTYQGGAPIDDGDEQAVNLGNAFGHGLLDQPSADRRELWVMRCFSTSGAMASSNCA